MTHPSRTAAVSRLPLPDWIEPRAVWGILAEGEPDLIWSDRSALADGVSFIGLPGGERDVLVVDGRAPALQGAARLDVDAVVELLRARLVPAESDRLGWWGWIGYEAASTLATDARGDEPRAAFVFARSGVLFDHGRREVTVVALDGKNAAAHLAARIARAVPLPSAVAPQEPPPETTWRLPRDAYLAAIGQCLARIRAGDAYQLCLTNRITVTTRNPIDVGLLHERLAQSNPAAFAGIVRIAGWALVTASPEQLLAVDRSGLAVTRPIKGTRPRFADPELDRASAAELAASEKERAENLMIVDLMRNDLSRVSEVGSVEVPDLFAVETLASVHHLVSTVRSRLVGDALSAVPAVFPAGSMTGAPKRSAMRILAGLERGPRGVYSGCWGRISVDGSLDLAVVIRSAVVRGRTATIGTGGGITALSDPAAEWDEIVLKARPLVAALGGALRELEAEHD